MLNNTGLVAHAISKLGLGYMYGFTGIVTEAIIQQKAIQYYRVYTATYIQKCRALIGRHVTDCSGLIDSYLGIDYNAKRYYNDAIKKGSIGSMPKEIPGILLFKYDYDGTIGHVGVCVGDGTIVEAKGIAYGVVRTVIVGNGWDLWAYCHLISYDSVQEVLDVLKLGDKNNGLVKPWQESLLKVGISVGDDGADDWFGADTEKATNIFKASQGLEQNGVVDTICWGKMALALMAIPGDTTVIKNELAEVKFQLETSQETLRQLDYKHSELIGGLSVVGKYVKV